MRLTPCLPYTVGAFKGERMSVSAWLEREAEINPGLKGFAGGTERLVAPAETVERLRPQLARLGITRLGNLTGLDRLGIPVYMATRPLARAVAVSLGKGLTEEAAMASALMESVESWHAERIARPLLSMSHEEIASTHPVIDVDRLALRPETAFPRHQPLLWIEAHDILQDRPVWLPYETVHTDYRLPAIMRSGAVIMSTNGLASGNHRLEAVLHAVLEIVERDATWRLKSLSAEERQERLVNLDTVEDEACSGLLERFATAGIEVAVWDTALRFDVPSFYCRLASPEADSHIAEGAGCHSDARIALSRTLTEAAQVRTTYIAGARDDLSRDHFGREIMSRDHVQARISFGSSPGRLLRATGDRAATFAEELEAVLSRLVSGGVDRIALVDLSGPVDGAFVTRVVMPGLGIEGMIV